MKKKSKQKKFKRPDDPYWNPDEEPADKEEALPVINETLLQSFVDEWQPEDNERLNDVRAIGIGELRELLQIYRTFDCKSPDPLPYYIARLESHGFRIRVSFDGEQSILVRKRNTKF